ncbi:MAG: hypothetical protein IPP84_15480 [Propionivibrio sp.]|uniref:hypothetical protein n=1 Tax=Propionivibrio sp. TaxID=2212460 RepID=UPI0025D83887|nr:hypothetical protein [Propionivibrio sp.]MBL0209277.1 hypothetical protein [Propionivibrio sp.]
MKRMTIRSLLLGVLLTLSTLPALAQKPLTAEDAKARLAKAEAMFQGRCKKSGEFIHKTAENVDGILLLKIRGQTSRGDQYKMDDPYGQDFGGRWIPERFCSGTGNCHLAAQVAPASLGLPLRRSRRPD